MKLPSSNITTETSGLLLSKEFSIGDAGIILEILRTKIYSDPILAICREYCSNARDAHREIGTPDRPIEVHFPNAWSTNLVIKDYGPGIDPSRMEDIFIRFGCSTKRSDNVQTGGFGLGCKVGFSYGDTFTVSTIVDNVKYTYSAYIDETKVGQMTLLQQEDTTEENGTSIEIPISRGDYNTFTNMVVKVTQHWKVKPQLFGQDAPVWKTYEYSYEGTRWKLPSVPENNRYSYRYNDVRTSLALIDGIAYKIDISSLVDVTPLHSAVLNTGFHFEFSVGELSLAASRDSIHYDENTQQLIIERIDNLIQEIVDIVSGQIKNATSYIDACNAYEKVKTTLNYSGLMDRIQGIQWQDNDIRLTIKTNDIGEWAKMTGYLYDSYEDKIKTNRRDYNINFRKDDVALYHHDIKTKSVPGYVIEHLLKDSTTFKSIQVVWTEAEPSATGYTDAVYRAKTRKINPPEVKYDTDLMKLMGFKSLQVAVDSVPKEKKKQRKSRGKISEGNVMGYAITHSWSDVNITSTSFPINQGGTFIQVNYKEKLYASAGQNLSPSNVSRLASFVGDTIIGFTEFRMKKLGSQWVPLVTKAKAKMEDELKNLSIKDINDAAVASNYLFDYHMGNISRLTEAQYRSEFNADSPLAAYIDESVRVAELLQKSKSMVPIFRFFGLDVKEAVDYRYNTNQKANPKCKLALLYNEVKDRYPLMKQLSTDNDDSCKAIIEYMNLIDNKIEQEQTNNNVLKLTG